jgi:beta-xylosidase
MNNVVYLDITKKSIGNLVTEIIYKDIPCPSVQYFDVVTDFIKRLNLHIAVNSVTKEEQNFFFQEDEPEAFTLFSMMLHWQQYIEENHPNIDVDLPSILKQWNSKFYEQCMKLMYAKHDYFRDTSFN